jgi:hypothetical protein
MTSFCRNAQRRQAEYDRSATLLGYRPLKSPAQHVSTQLAVHQYR